MPGIWRLWLLLALQWQRASAGAFLATERHLGRDPPMQQVSWQAPVTATPEELLHWAAAMESNMTRIRLKFLDLRDKMGRARVTMSEAAAGMMKALQESSSIEVNLHLATLGIKHEKAVMATFEQGINGLNQAAKSFNETSSGITLLSPNASAEMQDMEDGFRMLSEGGNASLRVNGMANDLDNFSQQILTAVNATVRQELRNLVDEQRQALINLTLVTPMPASTAEPAAPPC
mmetsp:Transcript_40817/g.73710  ORF Transcript_40817/g.73710 Transcript_40817/m.73710 type:complete len:233 (+) Transcript_40817:104-802(+)